jgi:nucleoside-diphosphate-sugar epimerase
MTQDATTASTPARRVVVTGAAGFVGSHLVDTLLEQGDTVVGIDCFTPYYDPDTKRQNLARALDHDAFTLVEADLREADLLPLVEGVDTVFHQAAQPGVRLSWSDGFGEYASHNVLATQRLLEAAQSAEVRRVVYASSSSVYGNQDRYPTVETDLPRPYSPYGVTKLAAEHLCNLYAENWGLDTVSLRYFTVFGPRQRPDMSIHRLCEAALTGASFPRFGDGRQVREFTYVADIVAANLCAADANVASGTVINIAGGGEIELNDLIAMVAELAGTELEIENHPALAGDARRNGGATDRAHAQLGWTPEIGLREGIAAQLAWHADRRLLV